MSALVAPALSFQAWAGGTAFVPAAVRPGEYHAYQRSSDFAVVRDGTRLAVTWYAPETPAPARLPTLLWYLPGHRESINPKTGQIIPTMDPADIAFFTSHGYIVAVAEMRGSGASFGTRELDRGPQIGRDGKDLVDWLAAQRWSDGAVGMIGASYQGFSQFATAAERPPALRAIFPEIAGFDDYTSMFNPGGIFVEALSKFAATSIARDDRNEFAPAESFPRLPSVPVVDENHDGQLADEIPIDANGNGRFDDDGAPTYATAGTRQDLYYRATLAHLQNSNLTLQDLNQAPYRDSLIGGTRYSYIDLDPGLKPGILASSGIAVYSRGGWYDYHARDTVMWFATLQGHTPVHLLMAPTGHHGLPNPAQRQVGDHMTPVLGGPYLEYFGDRDSNNDLMNAEKLRFFDRYVRRVDNGFENDPPVLIYVMGRGWRREREWPLARSRLLRYSLSAHHTLVGGRAQSGVDQYQVDLHTSSLSNGANRWNYGIARAQKPMSLDASHPRLAYASAVMPVDREITGHPRLQITLSSSADEGDVFAYLEDVAPDGSALLVTEGELRANYPALHSQQTMLPGSPSITVKPVLPWHGFAQADYHARPFAHHQAIQLTLDFMPTSWVFKKGHRIRLALAGADWPTFALHPALSAQNNPDAPGTTAPVWQVRRGGRLSVLELPWIP